MMNRLNIRLLLAFSVILIVTLCIMWVALLLVLRSQPANTDSEAIDLSAILLDSTGRVLEQVNQSRQQAIEESESLRDRLDADRQTFDSILRETLEEQSALNDVRFLVVRGSDCVIWDTPGYETYPRLLDEPLSGEALLGTNRPLATGLVTGKLNDSGAEWLFVALPRASTLSDIVPENVSAIVLRNAVNTCGEGTDEADTGITLAIAQPYPEHTIRSILQEYEGDGLFFALIQAVIIGLFFALITTFMIVRWVSRPLKDVAATAFAIAQGNYDERAPIRGPAEIRVMANTFNQMASQVESTQQAQRDFLANVSHDLRTPLTSIQGFAQAISEGVAAGEQARSSANIIENEATRMSRMVNDLLELARIQSGRLEMLRHSVVIEDVLQRVAESLKIKAQQKGLQFYSEIGTLPKIAGDGDRLAQVFTNLVDNAIKHTDTGGKVWLRALTKRGGVLIQVEDTGEGIPAADLPRIFERFYQVDKSRTKRQGSGLGLAISYEIVTAHGGRIWVESEAERGTRFSVWLPQPSHDPGDTVLHPRH